MVRKWESLEHGMCFPPPLALCYCVAHTSCLRHEAAVRTCHVTGTSNVLACDSWETAVEAYTEAFQERRLRISGQVATGHRMTFENIRFN